jgi:hypothetical protein
MALNVDGSISFVEGRDDVDDEEQSRLLLLREKNNVRFISFFFSSLNLSLFSSSSLMSEEVERERQLEGAAVADLFDDGEVCLRCRRRPWRIEGEVDDDKIWCIKCVKVFQPRAALYEGNGRGKNRKFFKARKFRFQRARRKHEITTTFLSSPFCLLLVKKRD